LPHPDGKKATLADKYGVSAERIRQIEKKAFSRMKGELVTKTKISVKFNNHI